MLPTPQAPRRTNGFESDVGRSVGNLRACLRHLFCSLGFDPEQPQTVTHGLGIDKTLAWKLCRLTRTADPLAAIAYLPGRAGLDAALQAAARAGALRADVASALQAAEQVRGTVETHAGSRDGFARLASSLEAGGGASRLGATLRRQAFRANAAIWGVQATTRVALHFVAPNAHDPSRVDLAVVNGLVDVLRLRHGVNWPVATLSSFGGRDVSEPLAAGSPDGIPLLPDFCSVRSEDFRVVPFPGGRLIELAGGEVGRTAGTSCLFGWMQRSFAPACGASGERGEHFAQLQTPVERALLELHVHRALPFMLPPEFALYSRMESPVAIEPDPARRYELPTHEPIVELVSGRHDLATPLLPRHAELVELAAGRLGHQLRDFRTFRVVLQHPPVPTVATFRHPLAPGPGLPA
jgi:hypothetical protein